jgi:hypothetical protein
VLDVDRNGAWMIPPSLPSEGGLVTTLNYLHWIFRFIRTYEVVRHSLSSGDLILMLAIAVT